MTIEWDRQRESDLIFTHLNVLLGVLKVLEQCVFAPHDARLLVGGGVAVAISHPGLSAEEAVKVRALLVRSPLLDRVTLAALGLEDLRSLLFAHGVTDF
jgi:hypothetical protein